MTVSLMHAPPLCLGNGWTKCGDLEEITRAFLSALNHRPNEQAVLYRFQAFSLDDQRFELRKQDELVHVEPLVFDLLLFFVRHAGQIIHRDELVASVWQGRVVSDATIASAIKSARRALDDPAAEPSLLRTVRGRGFEFVAEVRAEALSDNNPPQLDSQSSASIATPTKVFEVVGERSTIPVIAVLPFANQSVETDAYFADGLSEDLITNLSRFRDLRVIAGASTFQFKDRSLNLKEIRVQLGAGYIVQGSIRRTAGRVRISVQLIDSDSGVQLWGDRFDRELSDIFELQDEVTRTIAGMLGVKVQGVALQRALRKRPHELDAYDCLLRARRYTWMLSAEIHAEARDLLEKAVELDPLSSDAHALLANVYLGEHRFETNPRPNPIGRALVHALAATQLDPQNAYARCWLAIVHFFRGELDLFEAEALRALELNPNDPETLADLGHYFAFAGEFDRGVELSKRAQQLNPLHPGWYYFSFARLHYHQRNYEEVLADVERVGMPHFYWTHLLRAAAQGMLGAPAAADSLATLFRVKPDFEARKELKKWGAIDDDLAHLMQGLRKAGLRE